MSVVVRMEMPKACWFCGLRFVCKAANDFLTTKETGCSVLKVGMPGCLIICQLPEGHGRLVDADKLADDMKARKAFFGRMSDPQCIVDDAPTIVPAEAKRSE
jgi:hypothetical protein